MNHEKVYAMKFSKVYPLLVAKAERKGRTAKEVEEVTCGMQSSRGKHRRATDAGNSPSG